MQLPPRDPALDALDALVGEWDTEATHPLLPGVIQGRATFEWLEGRRFLIVRSSAPPGTIPSAVWIIGGGDTPGIWPMHYFDERGVERIYSVSFADRTWRMWRDEPGFSQRMTGVLEEDGRTLRLSSELQRDADWRPDLAVTYRRKSA